jgi:hypothetical protein
MYLEGSYAPLELTPLASIFAKFLKSCNVPVPPLFQVSTIALRGVNKSLFVTPAPPSATE